MAKGFIGAVGYKAYLGSTKLKAGYIGANQVYSTGSTVTYVVDGGTSYTEEVDSGMSCLSPRTFTPFKAGWNFVGWRPDIAATAEVYNSLIMGDSPITLYAVFGQTVTVTYQNIAIESKLRYYNNGTVTNPAFSRSQPTIAGWTPRGWSAVTAGNGGITYNNGATFTRDSDITLYAMYQQDITLSYNGNGATDGGVAAQTNKKYYNYSSGAVINPSFVIQGSAFTRLGYTFENWALNGGTRYNPGTVVTLDVSATMYAMWVAAAYYAYQNGYANTSMGINNPTFYVWDQRNGSFREGPVIQIDFNAIGFMALITCESGKDGPRAGITTNLLPTNGLSNAHIEIVSRGYHDHGGIGTATYRIHGITTAGADVMIREHMYGYYDNNGVHDLDVSGYTHIMVYLLYESAGGSSGLNKKIFFGIKEVRFY